MTLSVPEPLSRWASAESEDLAQTLQSFKIPKPAGKEFTPDVQVAGHIKAEELVGEMHTWHRDKNGQLISRCVVRKGSYLGIADAPYLRIVRL